MWNPPSQEDLAKLPALYFTEPIPTDKKLIHMHFFLGSSDWYAAEYDQKERLFFGYVVLNGDHEMAEWGYFSLDELLNLKVGWIEVDRDLAWDLRLFKEIKLLS